MDQASFFAIISFIPPGEVVRVFLLYSPLVGENISSPALGALLCFGVRYQVRILRLPSLCYFDRLRVELSCARSEPANLCPVSAARSILVNSVLHTRSIELSYLIYTLLGSKTLGETAFTLYQLES